VLQTSVDKGTCHQAISQSKVPKITRVCIIRSNLLVSHVAMPIIQGHVLKQLDKLRLLVGEAENKS
jgi:hypothetical protein